MSAKALAAIHRQRFAFAVGGLPALRAHLKDEGADDEQIMQALWEFNKISLGGAWSREQLEALTRGYEEFVRLVPEADPAFLDAVEDERERMLIRDLAKERRDSERFPPVPLPPVGRTLADALSEERSPLAFTVERLHVAGGNTLIVAGYKAGKTTLALNLLRSLVDGTPFLGEFATALSEDRRVAYLNYELGEAQIIDWFARVDPEMKQSIVPLSLRGQRLHFWLPHLRSQLAKWLQDNNVSAIVVDPAGRAWQGLVANENDNSQVRAFTDALDELKAASGVQDAFVLHHTGRREQEGGAERARGATTLEDWMDAGWYLTKHGDGTRTFRAEGRDVDVEPTVLAFDEATKTVTWTGTARSARRREQTQETTIQRILQCLSDAADGLSSRDLRDCAGGRTNGHDPAKRAAIDGGLVVVEKQGNKAIHRLTDRGRDRLERNAQ